MTHRPRLQRSAGRAKPMSMSTQGSGSSGGGSDAFCYRCYYNSYSYYHAITQSYNHTFTKSSNHASLISYCLTIILSCYHHHHQ